MVCTHPHEAIATIPPGQWAVGVSGGADSVALIRLLAGRPGLTLHIVHLNHETRGNDSDNDAAFVGSLARHLNLPCTSARLSTLNLRPIANASARYRAARRELFRRVIREQGLDGVLLAHHRDDLVETVLLRLLRGRDGTPNPAGLIGMTFDTAGPPRVLRPLLTVSRQALRDYLTQLGQAWREDASNASGAYARNRVRQWLATRPALAESLLGLQQSAAAYDAWLRSVAPQWSGQLSSAEVARWPAPIAWTAAKRWLEQAGCPGEALSYATVQGLLNMATDAATPARRMFPGGVMVCRRRGVLSASLPASSRDTVRP
jgi:tRNA(Ile)-lysidine synthase